MSESFVSVRDITICYETFGSSKNPCVLLIMGAGAQGTSWDTEFCRAIANAGFYVIRFDHRDVGKSTCRSFSSQPYDLNILKEDILAFIEALGLKKFHLAGTSMGGFLSQLIAAEHPEKILSLTLMATSCDFTPFAQALSHRELTSKRLPPPRQESVTALLKKSPPPTSQEEGVEQILSILRAMNGSKTPFDEAFYRIRIIESFDRASMPSAAGNHMSAIFQTPRLDIADKTRGITIPTLIIQGEDDPLFSVEHGEFLASILKNSTLLIVPNMGHLLDKYFETFLPEMIKHLLLGQYTHYE